MCVVSMVHDQFRYVPQDFWNRPRFDEYQDIINRLKRLEAAAGIPDCEDEEKRKWADDLEERLRKLEKASQDHQAQRPKMWPNGAMTRLGANTPQTTNGSHGSHGCSGGVSPIEQGRVFYSGEGAAAPDGATDGGNSVGGTYAI